MTPLLTVEDLRVEYPTRKGVVAAVRGLSFTLGRERLGIVGESGSGKSQTGRAIMGLTPPQGRVTQDPKYSLNPVMSIGRQIIETLQTHETVGAKAARDRALEMLEAVQIRNPERVFDLYPHEVSGGMGQRVMIAMMLIVGPSLLIADEPTSALDVTVQLDVLSIMDDLVTKQGMGLIFVSHDLRLVSSFCDRVLVMYAGRVVEEIAAANLAHAQHPYTRGLLACMPTLGGSRHPLPISRWMPPASASPPGRPSAWSANPDRASPRCCARWPVSPG
jgi:peptide/nickel transport system ATP-binding protein